MNNRRNYTAIRSQSKFILFFLNIYLSVYNWCYKKYCGMVLYRDAYKLLNRWKKQYPETFNNTKAVVILNEVAQALVDSSPLPVPKTEKPETQYDVSVFPHNGRSNDLIEGPDNPTRNGQDLSHMSEISDVLATPHKEL